MDMTLLVQHCLNVGRQQEALQLRRPFVQRLSGGQTHAGQEVPRRCVGVLLRQMYLARARSPAGNSF